MFPNIQHLSFIKKIPKSYKGWPQQPPTEKVPNISKKLDFWWSIPQKGTSIGHFGARDDQTIRIRKLFGEIGLFRSVRLQRPLRSIRLERFLRPRKSLLRTSELSRILNSIIWVLISLYFDVLKKKVLTLSLNITLNLRIFSVGCCWGQPM